MPTFKTDIDLQKNQLLNAVVHNLPVMPSAAVEGQIYYNTLKKSICIWTGSDWEILGQSSGGTGIRQFTLDVHNPATRTGLLIVRLYQNLAVLRIDSHIDTGSQVDFHIEHRSSINVRGTMLTDFPIPAVSSGTETTVFANSLLSADNWLYLYITDVSGTIGVLTITITCSTI